MQRQLRFGRFYSFKVTCSHAQVSFSHLLYVQSFSPPTNTSDCHGWWWPSFFGWLWLFKVTCLHLPVVFNCLLYMLCLSLHATCLCMCWSLYLCCFVSFVDAKRQVFKVWIPLLVPCQDSTLFYTINVPWELKRSVFFSLKSVCVILKELRRYSFAYFYVM
jgi:hypothetical protein